MPNTDVATVKAGITAELNAKDMNNDGLIEFGENGSYTIPAGWYYSENGTKLNTDDELLAVIKKGGIIRIEASKI